ncbi:MAG: YiaA/YiaB family inner membrane protein [Pseudomonadota bacterium]
MQDTISTMEPYVPARKKTNLWTIYTIFSFIVAAGMVAGGIYNLEASFAAKGFYAMSTLMLVHTTVLIAKMMRDGDEAELLAAQLEKARVEKLLREQTV